MVVSQIAYDRFVLELPEPEGDGAALADATIAREAAGWLSEFGTLPLIGIVQGEAAWLDPFGPREVTFEGPARACVLGSRAEIGSFLVAGAPHASTTLLWPSRSIAKLLEALILGPQTSSWLGAVDAHARVTPDGKAIEVVQVQPG